MTTICEITILVVNLISILISIPGYMFIVVVNTLDWMKNERLDISDQLISGIGLLMLIHRSFHAIVDFVGFTKGYLTTRPEQLLINLLYLSIIFCTLLFSTWLSIHFCLKIVNVNHNLYISIQRMFPKMFPWILLPSVLASLVISAPVALNLAQRQREPVTGSGSQGKNDFQEFANAFSRMARGSQGRNDSQELEDIFNKITQGNKNSNLKMFEGDVLVKSGRSAITCTSCYWPKSSLGTVNVPYIFSYTYNSQQQTLFKTAMQEFETLTCVRFVPRTTETDYINITGTSTSGCASYIGRVGGPQQLYLSPNTCMLRGIIQHEFNHAIGFVHEQSRSDRDNYVTIVTRNIAPEYQINFQKYNTNNLGLEYDPSSVMHYPRDAFAISPGLDTIIPKPNPYIPIGQRYGLSVLDVSKINKLYNCNQCANLLNEMSGSFTSANYPSIYPNKANCVWLIRTPGGQVAIQFAAFDLQSSSSCAYDYLKIYDGPSKSSPVLLEKTCGSKLVPLLVSSTNQMLVEFVSDDSVAGTGFKAMYAAIQCGGAYYETSKTFSSPGYPLSYYSYLDCGWIITAPAGHKITLTVTDFAVESEATCSYDYLAVFDGPNVSSRLMGKYCSVTPPVLVSTGNVMLIRFHSDDSVQLRGFQATYYIYLGPAHGTRPESQHLELDLSPAPETRPGSSTWNYSRPESSICFTY
ncbi:embryonic protein UVS.2-like [Leptodactylus fuscus]|uniref:embryonic protein UVS.2-like n=1 Tax=Leptodactylus fuscus TaxID=238119 RepID=UPI003F4E7C61